MPSDNDTDIGSWVKQARKARDLKQVELAKLVLCGVATIKRIEQNRYRASKDLAERLAHHLNIAPEEWPRFIALARGRAASSDTAAASVGVVNLIPLRNSPLSVTTPRGEVALGASVHTGELVTVTFTIRNSDTHHVGIRELVAGARGPGGHREGWDAPHIPFPPVYNLALHPGETHRYQQSRPFYDPGDYFIEPVFQDYRGDWHGIMPFTRVNFFVLDE